MVIMDKPFPEDNDIEKEISGQKYGKKQYSPRLAKPDEDVYLKYDQDEAIRVSVSYNAIIDLVSDLAETVRRLEDKVSKVEQKQEEYKIRNLLDQNEASVMELESIFSLDEFEEPETLEGLLSEFVDKNENSLEMVRSVRDNY